MDGKLEKPFAVRQAVASNFEKASFDYRPIEPSANSAFTRVQPKADTEAEEFVGGKAPNFLHCSELKRDFSFCEQIESCDTASDFPQEAKRETKYLDTVLRKAKREIKQHCAELSLPQKLEDLACQVLSEAESARVNFNKKISAKKASAIVFACHLEKFHLGKNQVAKALKASTKEVNRCVTELKAKLGELFDASSQPQELACNIIEEVFEQKAFMREELSTEKLVLFKQSA